MAYIDTVPLGEAEGTLRREYDEATARSGRIWNIVRIMSPNPETLRASMQLYLSTMHGPSPLSRAQREMIAVVVSRANGCHY